MCKGDAWKGENVWHCSDGETKRAAIEGARAGRKKETESRSPVIAGDSFSLIPKSPWKMSIMILSPKRKPSMNMSENS